jgi:hypothetical protein
MGTDADGFKTDLAEAIRLPFRWLELEVGQGFGVSIFVPGSSATKLNLREIPDQFGAPKNRKRYVPQLHSEVAIKNIIRLGQPDAYVKYTQNNLPAGATAWPGFAWVVPESAEAGDMLYAGLEVNSGPYTYYAVYQITVVDPPAAVPAPEPVETYAFWHAILAIGVIIVGVTAIIWFFFLSGVEI